MSKRIPGTSPQAQRREEEHQRRLEVVAQKKSAEELSEQPPSAEISEELKARENLQKSLEAELASAESSLAEETKQYDALSKEIHQLESKRRHIKNHENSLWAKYRRENSRLSKEILACAAEERRARDRKMRCFRESHRASHFEAAALRLEAYDYADLERQHADQKIALAAERAALQNPNQQTAEIDVALSKLRLDLNGLVVSLHSWHKEVTRLKHELENL